MSVPLGAGDLLRLALALAALLALADGARRLVAARLPRLAGMERGVATAVVAVAAAIGLVQLLGFAGALGAPALLGGAALLYGLARWGASRPLAAPAAASATSDTNWSETFLGREWEGLALGALGAALLGALLLRALLAAPTEWDGLSYHLFYAGHWIQQGSLAPVELGQPHDKAALFPANGELLHVFTMTLVRSDLLAAAGMVLLTALFGLAVAVLARALGARGAAAAGAGLLAATLPALLSRAASSYVEPLLDFGLVAALLFARRTLAAPNYAVGSALVAGLATGLAAGSKYVALPLAGALAVALALGLAVAARPRRLAPFGAFAAGAAALGGAWYLRNALLTGNPVYPSPLAGLPHLERAGLYWEGSSLAALWRDLAARDLLGDALFALPPARVPPMSLGPLALGLLLAGGVAALLELAAALRAARAGERATAVARLLAPLALLVLALTYLRLPFWRNLGLFRSEVRFAVPAAAVAIALAVALGARRPAAARAVAALAAAGALYQTVLAAALPPLGGLLPGAALVAPPLLLALALAWAPTGRQGLRLAARAGAFVAAVIGLFAAWSYREAGAAERLAAPGAVHAPFARAAQAIARERPAAVRLAWASSAHNEFLYLFLGRRLERAVVAVPVHGGPRGAWRYRDGDPRRSFDRAVWQRELERAAPDLLVLSRWRAWRSHWPPERRWAEELGLPEVWSADDFVVYDVAGLQGTRGGPQPARQPLAR